MKLTNSLFLLGAMMLLLAACGPKEKPADDDSTDSDSTAVSEEPVEEGGLKPGETPFDFPVVGTDIKAGDIVLTPSYGMYAKNLEKEDPTKATYIFYNQTMVEPGEKQSKIKFLGNKEEMMPNSMLIGISPGQEAKKGDIVLTWWQTGSGMMRGIVTDDANPKEPKVRYLDLLNNPMKDSKTGTFKSDIDYQLKPNSFVKISNEWQEGNMIAAPDKTWGFVTAQIVKIEGNKVLTVGFAGRMKVYPKNECVPMPIKPNVKAGDKVKVVGTSSFVDADVLEVNKQYGWAKVKTSSKPDGVKVAFGEIIASLPDKK